MLQVAELDRLSDRLTDLGSSPPRRFLPQAGQRRQLRYQDASLQDPPRLPPPRRLALTMRAPSPTVGSFAFAVRDFPDSINIMSNKYMKAPILQRLNLTEHDICLASFLSDKGPAACPHSTRPGHERADSPAHVFSEELLALRPTFEAHPFKVPRGQAGPGNARRAAIAAEDAPHPRRQPRFRGCSIVKSRQQLRRRQLQRRTRPRRLRLPPDN